MHKGVQGKQVYLGFFFDGQHVEPDSKGALRDKCSRVRFVLSDQPYGSNSWDFANLHLRNQAPCDSPVDY